MPYAWKVFWTQRRLRCWLHRAKTPIVLWSGGKDSQVLLHLCERIFPTIHVMYYRWSSNQIKTSFVDSNRIQFGERWHEAQPLWRGIHQWKDRVEVIAQFPLGQSSRAGVPLNVDVPSEDNPGHCAFTSFLLQPTFSQQPLPFDYWLSGHKSCDHDPLYGDVPLVQQDYEFAVGEHILFPLEHWSDEDIWRYIRQHHLPVDEARYTWSGKTHPATRYNPDHVTLCTNCCDETKPFAVWCPLFQQYIDNISAHVPRIKPSTFPYMRSSTLEQSEDSCLTQTRLTLAHS